MKRTAVSLILLTVLSYLLVRSGYHRLTGFLEETGPRITPAGPGPGANTPGSAAGVSGGDYGVIVRRNIFGAGLEGKADPGRPAPEKLAQTRLRLSLQGTVTGNRRDARAIIVDEKKKKQQIYHIGDRVQGALITAIERGKVILEVKGHKEVLYLKKRKSPPPGTAMPGPVGYGPGEVAPVVPDMPPVPHRRVRMERSAPAVPPGVPPDMPPPMPPGS